MRSLFRHVAGTLKYSFVLLALVVLAGNARAAGYPVFEVDPKWPQQLPHGYVFGPSGGVTVDAKGNIWVYSRPTMLRVTLNDPPEEESGVPAPSVIELTPDGRFVRGWGGRIAMPEAERAKFDWPIQEHGIAVDGKGNVWVCGNGRDPKGGKEDNQCLKFTADGKFLMQVGKAGQNKGSLDTTNLGRPSQPVYWAKTNEIFISDGYGNRRVVVIDADTGKFKRMWGAYGKAPDDSASRARVYKPVPQQFTLLHGMGISQDGTVYVADRDNHRIQSFTLDGKFLNESVIAPGSPMTGNGSAFGVAFSGDREQRFLYVADGHNQKVRILDRKTLKEISGSAFGHIGLGAGQIANIHVIANDTQGNLYIGDGGGRFQKFLFKGLSQ
jgi:sugar lactone lactonase YvrE